MQISLKELSYSSMDVISAIRLCQILNTTVEDYYYAMEGAF